ncbi:MAG TPA: hypothetical protein VKS03_02155 [Thermoanaerobaculia bacterium]|nr:hypothetical protein [Thermoanaerobaculia bacterium]
MNRGVQNGHCARVQERADVDREYLVGDAIPTDGRIGVFSFLLRNGKRRPAAHENDGNQEQKRSDGLSSMGDGVSHGGELCDEGDGCHFRETTQFAEILEMGNFRQDGGVEKIR